MTEKTPEEWEEVITTLLDKMTDNMVDMDPEFAKMIDKYFWELI